MERFSCKLCLKDFPNGRALGGHMRSHMVNPEGNLEEDGEEEEEEWMSQLSEQTESASSSSTDGEAEEEDEGNVDLFDGPRRFSFGVGPGSVESNQNLTQQRFKRAVDYPCESGNSYNIHHRQQSVKKLKLSRLGHRVESWVDPEPSSPVSETTTEEDVAFCLMMLSRDNWRKKKKKILIEEDDDQTDESEEFKSNRNKKRGNYRCETCNKSFKSYQALGGHRASHKKNRVLKTEHKIETGHENGNGSSEKRIHECPVCFRVFPSGQALGGHKRSHGIGNLTENSGFKTRHKLEQRFIDLNLPAPMEEDDMGQIEVSVII